MADEIRIQFVADASPIAEAMQAAASAVESGGATITNALNSAGQSASRMLEQFLGVEETASNLGAQMSGAATNVSSLATSEAALSSALDKLLAPLTATGSILEDVVVPANTALRVALDGLLGPLASVGGSLGELTSLETRFSAILDTTFASLNETAGALVNISEGEVKLSTALDTLLEPLIAVDDLLAETANYADLTAKSLSLLGPEAEGLTPLETALSVGEVAAENLSNTLNQLKSNLIGTGEAAAITAARIADVAEVSKTVTTGTSGGVVETASAAQTPQIYGTAAPSAEELAAAEKKVAEATTFATSAIAAAKAEFDASGVSTAKFTTLVNASTIAVKELGEAEKELSLLKVATASPASVSGAGATQDQAAAAAKSELTAARNADSTAADVETASTNASTTATAENTVASTAGTVASSSAATAATSAATAQGEYTVALGAGVTAAQIGRAAYTSLQTAIAAVAQAQAGGVTNAQLLSSALTAVQNAAKQAGLATAQLGNTITVNLIPALQQTAQAANTAGASAGNLNNRLAGATAQMAAMDLGAGRLGYTFRILGSMGGALGSVLQTIFVPVLITTFVEIISNLVDKFAHLEDEVRKAQHALSDIADSATIAAQQIELQNLKLEDQISKLEGRPVTNRLQEALFEATIEANKLSKALGDALNQELNLLETQSIGNLKGLFTGVAATSDLQNILKPSITALEDALRVQVQARNAMYEAHKYVDEVAVAGSEGEKNRAAADLAAAKRDLDTANDQVDQAKEKARSAAEKELGKIHPPSTLIPYSNIALPSLPTPDYGPRKQALEDFIDRLKTATKQEAEIGKTSELKTTTGGLENEKDAANIAEKRLKTEQKIREILAQPTTPKTTGESGEKESAEKAGALIEEQVLHEYQIKKEGFAKEEELFRGNAEKLQEIFDKEAIASAEFGHKFLSVIHATAAAVNKENEDLQNQLEKLSAPGFKLEKADKGDKTAEIEAEKVIRDNIALATKSIQEQIKSTQELVSLGLESRRQEQTDLERILTLIQQKRKEAVDAITAERDALLAKQAYGGAFGVDPEAAKRLEELTKELATATERYDTQLENVQGSLFKLTISASKFFTQMKNGTLTVSETFTLSWQHAIEQFNSGMANAFADLAVKGSYFGQSMYKVAQGMLSDFIKVFVTLAEQKLEVKIASALGIKLESPEDAAKNLALAANTEAISANTLALDAASQRALAALGPAPFGANPVAQIGSVGGVPDKALGSIQSIPGATGAAEISAPALTANTTAVEQLSSILTTQANLPTLGKKGIAEEIPIEQPLRTGALDEDARRVAQATKIRTPEELGYKVQQAGTLGGGAAEATQQTASNAKLATLYQQDVATKQAAEAQKAAITTTSQTTQTSTTTGGETARAGVGTAGVAKKTAQEATKTAAHATGEATQTSATVAGEASRTAATTTGVIQRLSLELAADAKYLAHLIMVVAHYLMGEHAKTSAVATTTAVKIATQALEAESDIGLAAATVFLQAIQSIPFPANLVAAPLLAATTYSQGVPYAIAAALAEGGLIQGSGTGTSDSIPAMLSHGEYVMRAAVVERPGVLEHLHALNRGDDASTLKRSGMGLMATIGKVAAFAEGGLVGDDVSRTSKMLSLFDAINAGAADRSIVPSIQEHKEINLPATKTIQALTTRAIGGHEASATAAQLTSGMGEDPFGIEAIPDKLAANTLHNINIISSELSRSTLQEGDHVQRSLNYGLFKPGILSPGILTGKGIAPITSVSSNVASSANALKSETSNTFDSPTHTEVSPHIHFHNGDINALDGHDVTDALRSYHREVSKIVSNSVRRGLINPRDFIK